MPGTECQAADWGELLKQQRLGYSGEPGGRAHELTWSQVEPSLPPLQHCASIDVLDLAEGPVRAFLLDPTLTLKDPSLIEVCPKAGRFMVRASEQVSFGKELLQRRLVAPVGAADLLQVRGRPLLNGLFGVEKGAGILRLIMNLTASNSIQEEFSGDTGLLPFSGQWPSFSSEADETLEWSYQDLKRAFYIFKLPAVWRPLFVFDRVYKSKELGLGTCP